VAVITQGLLLWPYFTLARLIAPYVVAGKGQEYKPDAAVAILVLLVVSTFVSALHVSDRSSRNRRAWGVVAVIVGAIGLVERLMMSGEVR
jgi:hypothetical protein